VVWVTIRRIYLDEDCSGATSPGGILDVLDSERSLFAAQDQDALVQSGPKVCPDLGRLCRALGGGGQVETKSIPSLSGGGILPDALVLSKTVH